jgi:hypothetical protein
LSWRQQLAANKLAANTCRGILFKAAHPDLPAALKDWIDPVVFDARTPSKTHDHNNLGHQHILTSLHV